MLLRNRFVFVIVCVLVIFGSFYRVTVNGQDGSKFGFVDLEHAEFCLESPIYDISCHLSGKHALRTCTLVLAGKICNVTLILVIYHQFHFLASSHLYSNLCMFVKLPRPDKVRHLLINTWNYLVSQSKSVYRLTSSDPHKM